MVLPGYLLTLLMGLVLGLMGGGGAILTVPILVYLFQVPPLLATVYSLLVVGLTSLFGLLGHLRAKTVRLGVGLAFALPAVIGVLSARRLILPAVPERLFTLGNLTLTKSWVIMVFFALLMLAAAISMLREPRQQPHTPEQAEKRNPWPSLAVKGVLIGMLTGLVGAGGGFLIVPALVRLAGLDIKEAAGTSLMIISISSLSGFLGEHQASPLDWPFLAGFTTVAIAGVVSGVWLSGRISSQRLKPAFAWFVLLMGSLVLITTGLGAGPKTL